MSMPRQKTKENVNSPAHYNSNGIESYDVIKAFKLDFALGNVIKYVLRAGKKGGKKKYLEDLKKAQWYLNKTIEEMENA